MIKHKTNHKHSSPAWLIILSLIIFGLFIALMLHGKDAAVINPKGLIAKEELSLMVFSVTIMLGIAIPTLVILYYFAWKYRESNTRATYDDHNQRGKFFVLSIWAIPTLVMVLLASVMWPATHKLEPKKPIDENAKPLHVKVVAMRWKWLFIYPEQNIATVNYVQMPVGTPVQFDLTADETPMSSFWIPNLGGQLYAMTGHVNRLNLIAEHAGDYAGSAAEINGAGFAGMKFVARASSKEDFDKWIKSIQQSGDILDNAAYNNLLKPSEKNPAAFYSEYEPDLYAKMLMKYWGSHNHQPAEYQTVQ